MARTTKLIEATYALGFPYRTFDPFLFCVYHRDLFPEGQENLGPHPTLLRGRDIGSDFSYRDGWSMYHGDTVPGFPVHPHRGFETITVVRAGVVDHTDSLGLTARYSAGDTQWMTAGSGIQHCEMFPLLNRKSGNPLDLFQIWLNLPARNKMCPPAFAMHWSESSPVRESSTTADSKQRKVLIRLVAGSLEGSQAAAPPPNSWATDPEHDVLIAVLTIPTGSSFTLPPARNSGATRAIYAISGEAVNVGQAGEQLKKGFCAKVDSTAVLLLAATGADAEVLVLQGVPIGEPVAHHGPFVMNTNEELSQAFADFRRTRFGGWKWPREDYTHSRETERHCVHPDGRKERPA
jgi:redox-sensitive bicupin YhaK (pirin superfamily)